MASSTPSDRTALTPEGFQRLQEELDRLRTTERSEIVENIKVAREFGDLAENAEYHAAKDAQALLETRILQLEARLGSATIVATSEVDSQTVTFGMLVFIKDQTSGKSLKYQVVGMGEGDPSRNAISIDSPVGSALMGRKRGDIVNVRLPSGRTRKLKITKISRVKSTK